DARRSPSSRRASAGTARPSPPPAPDDASSPRAPGRALWSLGRFLQLLDVLGPVAGKQLEPLLSCHELARRPLKAGLGEIGGPAGRAHPAGRGPAAPGPPPGAGP